MRSPWAGAVVLVLALGIAVGYVVAVVLLLSDDDTTGTLALWVSTGTLTGAVLGWLTGKGGKGNE